MQKGFQMKGRIFAVAVVSSTLLACSDLADPAIDAQSPLFARGGRWAQTTTSTDATAQDNSVGTIESGIPHMLRFTAGAPGLTTYDTTFVAHQGWKQHFVILHEDGNYFMVLDVPGTAQFVDANGNPVPEGEQVEINVHVDGTYVSFEFGPHGSYFTGKRPVVLWVYLKYVDLEGASGQAEIWYQPNTDSDWAALPTTVDKAGKWLKVQLRHFSNYAVAW